MPLLQVEHGPDKGLSLPINPSHAVVTGGRADDNDIQLQDGLASARHFRVTHSGEACILRDLGSTNGTFFNGERLGTDGVELSLGDSFQVGDTYISFLPDPHDSATQQRKASVEIPGFEMLARVGVGGMGVVFRARQTSLDREVAIKVLSRKLSRNHDLIQRFISEAHASGELTHANVVHVHDVGYHEGNYYICMEYVSGGNLSELLRTPGRLEQDHAIRIAMDVARGLEYAERKSIVHCDIKPENIMLTETGMAKIADLGISRRLDSIQPTSQHVQGSPHYMAPEQAQGKEIDHRVDLYALGCTMFRMLAGCTPYSGSSPKEIMHKQVFEDAPDLRGINPDVPEALAKVVEKLMAKDPDKRYRSATELLKALEKVQTAAGGTPKKKARRAARRPIPGTAPPKGRRAGARLRQTRDSSTAAFLPIAVGLVLLAVGAVGIWYRMAPDSGELALKQAERLVEEGRYQEAQQALDGKGSSQREIAERINDMRVFLRIKILEQQAEQRFQEIWQAYLELKATNPGVDRLREELDRLQKQFGDKPERQALIDRERRSL